MAEWQSGIIKLMKTAMLCGLVVLGFLALSRTAGAYALGTTGSVPSVTSGTVAGYLDQAQQMMNSKAGVPGAPAWLSGAMNAISQWFQNIMALGAQATGAPVPITIAGPLGSSITVPAQNLLAQFDAWLYSIAHFHIALVINFIFGLIVWFLGVAKDAVTWLNSVFKSAAGK
jgi:hypothetical protein